MVSALVTVHSNISPVPIYSYVLSTPTFHPSPYNILCTLLCPLTLKNMSDTGVHGERKHESLDFKNKLKYLYLFSGMLKKCECYLCK